MTVELPETYVRHQGATTDGRVFPDGGYGDCLVCEQSLGGRAAVLVPIGCDDPEDQAKMRRGGWVSARAVAVHAACAGLGA
jgi:hypothetical protein